MRDSKLIEGVIPSYKYGRRLGLTDEETEKYAQETYEDMVEREENEDAQFCKRCGAKFMGMVGK